VPIKGATLAEAAKKFRDHLNYVLSRTVTQTPAVLVEVPGAPSFQITFRQAGQPVQAQLNTRFSQIGFYLGQVCRSIVRKDKLHELRTLSYKYALYSDRSDEPIIRWEYVREPGPQDQWCRHHLQGPIEIRLNQAHRLLERLSSTDWLRDVRGGTPILHCRPCGATVAG